MATPAARFQVLLAMPQLSFDLDADGMVVLAAIGLSDPQSATMARSKQPIPPPIRVRALLDSGTDRTAVAPHVFQRLGLAPLIYATAQTAGGAFQVNLYRVGLTIFGPSGDAGPVLALPDLLVSELTVALSFDALIGLDVLRECLLVLDGPGRRFILAF
jgi:hypothetical protein